MEYMSGQTEKETSPEAQLESAQSTADWLVPFLYGVEVDAQDEVAQLVNVRVSEIVGTGELDQQLAQLRELFSFLPSEHKNNAVLYCVGYPKDALEVLADGDIQETIDLLMVKGEVYRPAAVIEQVTIEEVVIAPKIVERPKPSKPMVPRAAQIASTKAVAATVRVADDWFTPSSPARDRSAPGESVDDAETTLAWQTDALCAQTDPEAFFPEKGGSTRDAKKICTTCDVKEKCLDYALENDERFGIWGGLSERERRKLRKRTGVTG